VSRHHRGVPAGDPPDLPPDLAAAVAKGGEMGRRFAEFDWATHPLGQPAEWPAELRTTVVTTLTSRFPIIVWLGAEDLFVMYNDAYIPVLGDRHPAALGQRGREVWWDIWDAIGPMLSSVIGTGKATWSDDLMLPIVRAGRRQERYFTFSYGPLITDDGSVDGVFAAVSETTERVLSERRLHLLNAVGSATIDMRTIDDAVAAAVAVCAGQPADLPFVAAYVGDEQPTLRGATPSVRPLLPRTLAELTDWDPTEHPRTEVHVIDEAASVLGGIEEVLGSDCPDQVLVLGLGDGSSAGALVVGINPRCPLTAQFRGFCQLLADQLSAALASAVSYEQERRRADALAELDRAKTAFLTNVSHEFRTPLTLLMGPLDAALCDAGSDELLRQRLSTARRNAGRLLRLVDSLLDFSRIEAGRATANLVCTDIGALTSYIAASFGELCERAGLDLVLDCRPALADIDPDMWETIVLNLLSNAVKYTLEGSISVEAQCDSGDCWIRITDTGIGMAQDDLIRLGERFFRADTARTRSVEGTGIGLSLVRGLVELQHGTLHIDSQPDRGTTVTIRVPRSTGDTPVHHAPAGLEDNPYVIEAGQWLASPPTGVASGDDGRQLVLIADDNADMRAHLEHVLSGLWRTVSVADGEAALDTARELRPAAVVTDVMMPRLDGFSLVAAIRADPELAATPIVMLSARAGAEAIRDGYAGGADDYLPKPFRSEELVNRLSARISAAARERAGQQQREAQLLQVSAAERLDTALDAMDSIAAILTTLLHSPLGCGHAAAVAIGVLDADEVNLRLEYAGAVPAEVRDRYHLVALDAPLAVNDVVKTGQSVVLTDTFGLPPRYQHAVQDMADAVRALVIHPLHGEAGHVIGALLLMWPEPRAFDTAELDMFTRTAGLIEGAVDRVRSMQREHRIAADFQEHLLDLDRGSTAAVVAAMYEPAGEAMRVGGDWYLVTPLPRSGQAAVSVGDVVGHGLQSAIVMSKLRAAVAASALTDDDPAAVLTALDRYAGSVRGASCATVGYAVIDLRDDDGAARIRYGCAGHPYPLVMAPGQAPVFLRDGRRPPVAVWEDPRRHQTATRELVPGTLVLLYTDGLIERPGEALDQGFVRLQGAVAHCADLPVGDICAALLDRMRPPGGYTDDVVVLALRPVHCTTRSFVAVLPAALRNIADARHRLRRWLAGIGALPQREADILLATGEAITNAIEHGSSQDPGSTVSIEAFLHGDSISATISDAGRWSGDSSASMRSLHRGRGLTLINGLADHVDTTRTSQGTRLTLRFDRVVG
jgi:signal transduction histidine kinase/CheY-like chemotaxis protein